MPLKGFDDLPKDVRGLIEQHLNAKDKAALRIAQEFSAPIQAMIDAVKTSLKGLDEFRSVRDDLVKQRKELKERKLAELEKNATLKKQFAEMGKADSKKLLDSVGDELEKNQLAYLKKAIAEIDDEIKSLSSIFRQAMGSLDNLKLLQKLMYDQA